MKKILFAAAICSFFVFGESSFAQILNPGRVLRDKAIDKANRTIDKAADDAVNKNEKKEEPEEPSEKDQKEEKSDSNNKKSESAEESNSAKQEPTLQSYSKFDFIPGDKVIFFEDFSQDQIGDFPAAWNTNGSGEVVNNNLFSGKWLRYNTTENIWNDAKWKLPENYTIEFDIIPFGDDGYGVDHSFALTESPRAGTDPEYLKPYDGHSRIEFGYGVAGNCSYSTTSQDEKYQNADLSGGSENPAFFQQQNKKYHIAFWITRQRVRMYQDENKLFDLPKAIPDPTSRFDIISLSGRAMISNIRVAAGSGDARSKLITEGILVSYGIYFDVNKDVLKPESYGTLKSIADALKENPQVRIKIVGHTDGDGNDAANLDLSKRRAAAVKAELVKTFGIDAGRMDTDGKGKTQPLAPNDSPSNKALNRRVEFIKL